MELRPYQQEAREAVEQEWEQGHDKTLLVLPTGCGKTIVFAKITEDRVRAGDRVLILAHRGELLEQAADKIGKATGLVCATEKAEESCLGSWYRVTVGSVQTLMRPQRLSRFDPHYFDTIIIDEAHHAVSDSYGRILEHFGDARVLGVTATPDRGDMRNLGAVFDSLAYNTLLDTVADVRREVQARTAWRIEGTLREFPKFPPVNLWFEFPIHRIDHSGMLSDVHADGDAPDWKRGGEKKKPVDKRQERLDKLRNAFAACDMEGKGEVSIADLAEYCGLSRNTVKTHVDEHPDFERQKDGTVRRVSTCQNQIDTPF